MSSVLVDWYYINGKTGKSILFVYTEGHKNVPPYFRLQLWNFLIDFEPFYVCTSCTIFIIIIIIIITLSNLAQLHRCATCAVVNQPVALVVLFYFCYTLYVLQVEQC